MKKNIFLKVLIIVLLFFILSSKLYKYFYDNNNNIICLLTKNPQQIWCDFLNNFKKYRIYIIVDDNTFDINEYKEKYKKINFIQFDDNVCMKNGYKELVFLVIPKLVTSWEKGLYYFTFENKNYEYIWFLEDDVFFHNENTLLNIDYVCENYDLLCNKIIENKEGKKDYWWWGSIEINYPPPYYNGLMPAIRTSKKFARCVYEYAIKNKTLFFLESCFPTIAIKNNLEIYYPPELLNITYKGEFKNNDVTKSDLYHPIKDLNRHLILRKILY
jgi:hypothetical protein